MSKLKRLISALLVAVMLMTVAPLSEFYILASAASNEKTVYDFFIKEMKVNTAVACGVLANIEKESSFNPNNSFLDTNGKISYGICQWNGTRNTNLKNYCKNKGLDYTTLNAQLQFLKYELEGSEKTAWSKVKGKENSAQGAYDAGYAWARYFERCAEVYKGVNQWVSRANLAKNTYWAKYKDSSNDNNSSVSNSNGANLAIDFAKSHCALDAKTYASLARCTKKGEAGEWLCAEFVYNCLLAGGYKRKTKKNFKVPYTLGEELIASGSVKNNCKKKVNTGVKLSDFDRTLKKGDVIIILYTNNPNGNSGQGHAVIYSGSTTSDGYIKVYAHNNRKQNEKLVTSTKTCSIYALTPNYQPANISVTNKGIPSATITNTKAQINASLSEKTSVKKWGYAISCNDNDKNGAYMKKINLEDSSTHEPSYLSSNYSGSISWHKVKDWDSDPQSVKDLSYTLSNLKPGKTYYIKFAVKLPPKKWIQSGVISFTTTSVKPGTPKLRVASSSSTIGIGDQATVLWDGTSNTDSYTITVKNPSGTVVKNQTGIKGLTQVFNCFSAVGTYTLTIASVNGAGTTTGNTVNVEVKPNATVTFFDTISQKNIAQVTVPYGHAADAPKNPVQEGHTFAKWDKSFDKVTSDIIVNTVYDKNSYTVRFIDNFTKKVLKTQTVKYLDSATAPDAKPPEAGYSLAGWDKDFSSVKSDMDVYTVFKWTDKDHNSTVTINSVTRNSTKQGYDVSVTVSNKVDKIISGRVVLALKSPEGTILTTTESEAFAIDATTDSKQNSKSISIFVPYSDLAYFVSAFVVNSYESLGSISTATYAFIDNRTPDGQWSGWTTYTGTCPVSTGNGITVETRDITNTTPEKNYYRYKIKTTTTSKATSLSGYIQNGYSLVKNTSGTISYVSSWPSGFNTSNSLYTKYNKTPKSASETSTQKTVIDSTATEGYIYWHWCRGGNYGAINRAINWSKSSTYGTFHAFYSTTKKTFDTAANAVKYQNTSACNDTYWWNSTKSGSSTLVTVKKQSYTIYDKLYNYYKTSDYSEWKEYSGSVPVANGGSAGTNMTYQNVETYKEPSKTTITHQYRTMGSFNPTISEPQTSNEQRFIYTFNLPNYANKPVTAWVYKYNQASDYTTELVRTGTLDSNGSWTIDDIMREAPSIETGDFTIAIAVDGQDKAFIVGKIEAPKPSYTVKFYDFDKKVISTQTIIQGDNATLPSVSELNVPDGMRFTNWSESVVNVRSNMEVFPEAETKTYVVAFVNWETKSVEFKEFNHGAELIADSIPEAPDGYTSQWVVDVDGAKMTIDEFTESGRRVTSNMVVGTESVLEKYNVIIISPNTNEVLDPEKIEDGSLDDVDIAFKQEVAFGEDISFGEVEANIEDNPAYIFFGWININTGEYVIDSQVTDDMILYPSYVFAETTEAPYANVGSGEYSSAQTITLTCDTPNAVIFYTTDGSDPATSDTAIEYTMPITLTESCQLKYYASALGMNDSGTITSLYAINTATSGKAFHIVSIVSNIDQYEGFYYEILMSNGKLSRDIISDLTNIEGYNFDGLYLDEVFDEDFDYQNEYVTESMTLYANYIPDQFDVIFKDSDGNVIATEKVEYMNSAEPPVAPTKEGYVFVGWGSDDYQCVTSDMTFEAKYVLESEYAKITLKKHSGTYSVGSSVTLKYTITPADLSETEIEWSSSDEDVATVNENGTVTFIGEGTAIVYATVVATGESDKCVFTVLGDPDKTLTLDSNSYLGFDSAHNLRGVKAGLNTVEDIKAQFMNDDLKVFDNKGDLLADSDLVGTGATVELYEGDVLLDYAIVIMTGDVNCDGMINNRDAAYTTRYIVDKEHPEHEYEMIALDVNGDGKVNNRDASMISRYLAGKEVL